MRSSRRTHHVAVRVTETEAAQLQQLAARAGVPVAALLRISVEALLTGTVSVPAPIAWAFGLANRL